MPKQTRKTNGESRQVFAIPQKLLAPIGVFLANQLKRLEIRRSSLEKDDPFVSGRSDNFASPDTTAAEQFGHARVEAMKAEMDRKIVQMRKALSRVKIGAYGVCENCGKMIDTDRLVVFPETTFCIECERKLESKRK
ncbi:MAG: TraR/DksA C4-type zinc finger protein [Patescibacteria group bacterium]